MGCNTRRAEWDIEEEAFGSSHRVWAQGKRMVECRRLSVLLEEVLGL